MLGRAHDLTSGQVFFIYGSMMNRKIIPINVISQTLPSSFYEISLWRRDTRVWYLPKKEREQPYNLPSTLMCTPLFKCTRKEHEYNSFLDSLRYLDGIFINFHAELLAIYFRI